MIDFLFFSVLGWLTLIAIFVLLCITVGLDRRGQPGPKWFALFVIVGAWLFLATDWGDGFQAGLQSVFAGLRAINWWAVGGYVLFGLVIYSPIGFRMELRTSARRLRRLWVAYLANNPSINAPVGPEVESGASAHADDALGETASTVDRLVMGASRAMDGLSGTAAKSTRKDQQAERKGPTPEELVEVFVRDANSFRHGTYVSDILTLKRKGREIDTSVNQPGLVRALGCWTFMWPFYATVLVLSDLLGEFFETVVDHVIVWANEKVQNTFRDVFKTT